MKSNHWIWIIFFGLWAIGCSPMAEIAEDKNPVVQDDDPCTLGFHNGISVSYQDDPRDVEALDPKAIHTKRTSRHT